MQTEINYYIAEISRMYKEGNATEHTYRPALKSLLEKITTPCPSKGGELTTGLTVTNEPKRIACGAPDYIVTRKGIPVGYIEAKDIGVDLNGKTNKPQFDRYKKALDNLIITDYLTFQLFEGENLMTEIAIGKILPDKIEPIPDSFNAFAEMIKTFSLYNGKAIKDSQTLAEFMAAKTQLLAEVIEKAIAGNDESNSLRQQLKGFQQVLLPAITDAQFADIYAQTIAYGMFVARLQDAANDNFMRQNAAGLIPQSNPFLRNLFQYIAGFDLDENIRWIVDSLADMFNYVDVTAIQKEFESKDKDPFLHFYEDFLTKYDKNLKTARGAYYTPFAVVKFIVQAVDDILKADFNIPTGLADNSLLLSPFGEGQGARFHRVQILDPATGTGTFLAEVVRKIYQRFSNNAGMWNDYVKRHLIPRLNGFEIMMSPYTMAHLKLEMILQEFGATKNTDRLHIYLTDALENPKQHIPQIPFAQWLSNEANEAAKIKNDVPVMVVLGNPPYSGISQNKGKWITDLIEDYKYIDGVHFNEKKHWLQDDYVKFLRFGQYYIEKNGEGVLAFINNNGFLDNPTFRGMRWNLLKAFDKVYIINLHGNSLKKETAPDGSPDQNVFDIMQGVSINIFVKINHEQTDRLAQVFYSEIYGKRTEKYNFLLDNSLQSEKMPWQRVKIEEPYYFFVPKDNYNKHEYEKGFAINNLFKLFTSGMVTANDALTIFKTENELINTTNKILNSLNPYEEFKIKDSRRATKEQRLKDLKDAQKKGVIKINYRPFDINYMYQFDKNEYWINSPRIDVMQHFINGENIGFVVSRQCADDWKYIFCTKYVNDFNLTGTAGRLGSGYTFPLYTYPKADKMFSEEKRKHNLNRAILDHFELFTNFIFSEEKEETENTFAPIDILDYIYAVLHSPTYRERYKEFLKIDFPRVPYPKNAEHFWKLAELGGKLRRLHLMEGVEPQNGLADYPIVGSNEVEKLLYTTPTPPKEGNYSPQFPSFGGVSEGRGGRVYINDKHYFDNIPLVAWNFYIGGYQPAQKWLKDRKGRTLNFEDIQHYQKIIRVLKETEEVMREVDKKHLHFL